MLHPAPLAQIEPAPAASDAPAPAQTPPAPRQRDLREQLMPADPLGLRPGEGSISGTPGLSESGRLSALATTGADSGPSPQERQEAQRLELTVVVLVIAGLLLAALWFYIRSGRETLAGHDNR